MGLLGSLRKNEICTSTFVQVEMFILRLSKVSRFGAKSSELYTLIRYFITHCVSCVIAEREEEDLSKAKEVILVLIAR